MNDTIRDEDIAGIEARHVVFCRPPKGETTDVHYVKEVVHLKDGSKRTRMKPWYNFKRNFWITQTGYQTHKEKKEWEHVNKLKKFTCSQSELYWKIANALNDMRRQGAPWISYQFGKDRELLSNPYVYGADINSTALIKRKYQARNPDLVTPNTVAAFDIETDVVNSMDDVIIMATLSFGDKAITAIDKKFVHGYADAENRIRQIAVNTIGDDMAKRGMNWEIALVDGPVEVVKACFKRAHEWQPDIIAIWNINFDLPKVLKNLKKYNVDPRDVFCDPSIPEEYRHFRYKVGNAKLTTASGKVKPRKWVEQWHTVFCPSGFYFIDAACAYKAIRTGQGDEPNYGLDAILKKHKVGKKLKIVKAADDYQGLEWHQFMQKNYPLEYCVYNLGDTYQMEMLDEETNDLRLTFPMMAGCSDYEDFSSQPRCSADNLHFFLLTKEHVIGTTGDNLEHLLDKYCVTREGWISTLPAHTVADNGLMLLQDAPWRTNIRTHVGDLDVKASYPNGGSVMNVSKDTTVREMHKIEGVDFETQREQGINLSAGHTNAVEICTEIFKLPNPHEILEMFIQDEGLELDAVLSEVPELVQQLAETA
jgi:hypothetical protein